MTRDGRGRERASTQTRVLLWVSLAFLVAGALCYATGLSRAVGVVLAVTAGLQLVCAAIADRMGARSRRVMLAAWAVVWALLAAFGIALLVYAHVLTGDQSA